MEDVIQILLDAGADPTARTGSKLLGDRSPIELAVSKQHKTLYQRIIISLKDAQGRRNPLTVGVPEKPTNNTNPELNMDIEHEQAAGSNQIHTKIASTKTTRDRAPKKRKTTTQKTAAKNTPSSVLMDSISSRTRSRTRIIP